MSGVYGKIRGERLLRVGVGSRGFMRRVEYKLDLKFI